jgi:hypothetical protein
MRSALLYRRHQHNPERSAGTGVDDLSVGQEGLADSTRIRRTGLWQAKSVSPTDLCLLSANTIRAFNLASGICQGPKNSDRRD